MNIQITVNGRNLRARKGDFLLDVCRDSGIRVPTLCSMAGFSPTGACRMCVVEIEGYDDLVPACSFPVTEGISVKTHSARVIRARKTIVELLLSSHPDDCMFCLSSSSCELQSLAVELSVNERKIRSGVGPSKTDNSSSAVSHNNGKCILCGRCIRICDDLEVSALEFVSRGSKMEVGTVGGHGLSLSSCISCGQCIKVCPTGSLQEVNLVEKFLGIIQDPENPVSVLVDPAVPPAIVEALGIKSVKDTQGLIFSALKIIGFDKVYSGSEAADLSLVQTAKKWSAVLESNDPSWYMTSTCPAWTHYIEQLKPEWIKHLLPVHTPLMSFAGAFRNQKQNQKQKLVYISSCVASKEEAQRSGRLDNGETIVDLVLSSRELIQILRLFGVQLDSIDPVAPDRLIKGLSQSSHLSSVSGGFLEALYNTYIALGKADKNMASEKLRGSRTIKKVDLHVENHEQTWIASSSISEAIKEIGTIERGKAKHVLLEVMACPSGCICGGGQPFKESDKSIKQRIKTVYDHNQGDKGINRETYLKYQEFTKNLGEPKFTFKEVFI